MKKLLQVVIILLFSFDVVSAQDMKWKEIKKNCFQKIVHEGSDEVIKNSDSITLTTIEMKGDDGNSSANEDFFQTKTTFEDLKLKLEIKNFNPELKKNSEYLIKFDIPKLKSYKYFFYLKDSISTIELNSLKEFLKKNYTLEKIQYTSKEQAAKDAKKEIGINSEDLFEGNIFPASIDISSKVKINTKKIQEKFSEIIDDIGSNEERLESVTLKIKT